MDALLILPALPGHMVLWAALVNRIHAVGIPRWIVNLVTISCFAFLGGVPLALGALALAQPGSLAQFPRLPSANPATLPVAVLLAQFYLGFCWIVGGTAAWRLAREALRPKRMPLLRRESVRWVARLDRSNDPTAGTSDRHHVLATLPGNEILSLRVVERAVELPRFPRALDGLTLLHMADLHFTGRIGKSYFRGLVALCNDMKPDLVALTGDLVDSPKVLDWIPELLGPLRATFGVYGVLGNHDARADVRRVRAALDRAGVVDLGGRWVQVLVRGQAVVLIGNELPWLAPAADMKHCPPRDGAAGPPRIVLSHSPDQLPWARAHEADLVLAGHTHGGQICLPLLGPIFTPSASGVRHAAGLFHEPPTVMHVTRGVSGELPLRWRCPPEVVLLTLHAPGA